MLEEEMVPSQSQQGARQKPIQDFCTWAQCFMLYIHDSSGVPLPWESKRLGSLHVLNSLPRQKIQVAVMGGLWPKLQTGDGRQTRGVLGQSGPSIFSRCFLRMDSAAGGWCEACLSFDHESQECPLGPLPKRPRPAGGPPKEEDPYCRNFNRNNGVCRFQVLHKCRRCNGDHPVSACPSKKRQ